MTNYNDGRIHGWNGGDCPVHPETEVEVWWRNCAHYRTELAGVWEWQHCNNGGDIIAFRVVKEHHEPKTIWVSEYEGGGLSAHFTEEAAVQSANNWGGATRTAVKYQEVVE